jgi:hypothetical protein
LSDTRPPDMPPPPFDGARSKIKRAYKHIRDFDREFQAFIQGNPYSFTMEGHHAYMAWLLTLDQPIPDELMLIVGDALHNIRAALDHCAWELISEIDRFAPENRQERAFVSFPRGRADRQQYESAIDGMKTLPDDTLRLLKELAVYPGGAGDIFLKLDDLDVTDKHKVIVPVVGEFRISGVIEHRVSRGQDLKPVTEIVPWPERVFKLTPQKTKTAFAGRSRFAYASVIVANFPVRNGSSSDLQLDENHYTSMSIFFSEVEPFPNKPILPTLHQFAELVSGVIDQFAALVSRRGA